jgi:tRNA modification GTPase
VGTACVRLADGFRGARAVASGVSVALVGPVNVGKSSLLNALVGKERALVAASPGTTRDYVEAQAEWDGVAVTVIDTAGLRETSDPVERHGIELGEGRVAAADVVLVVSDSERWDDARFADRALRVRSKADLAPTSGSGRGPRTEDRGPFPTSVLTGAGLDELKRAILAQAGVADREGSEDAVVTTARQHAAVSAAREAIARASAMRATAPTEITALELREAARSLAELRGVEVGERVLDEVFARFCIGK